MSNHADYEGSVFPFWPALFLLLAFDLLMASQIHDQWRISARLQQQNDVVAKRVQQAEIQMKGARTWQVILEGICKDMLEMSKTDSDVRRIVDKYQIRQNQTPASSAPPAPDSSPAQ